MVRCVRQVRRMGLIRLVGVAATALVLLVNGLSASSAETRPSSVALKPVAQIGARANDVAVWSDHAYMAAGGQIHVVDVSAPDTPVLVGRSKVDRAILTDVIAPRSDLVVARGARHLVFFDTSGPSTPAVMVERDVTSVSDSALCADGDTVFASADAALEVFDVSGAVPILVMEGELTLDTPADICAADDGRAYVIDYEGFSVISDAEEESRRVRGRTTWVDPAPDSTWIPTGADAQGDLLAISGYTLAPDSVPTEPFESAQPFVRIFDTSDPMAPKEIAAFTSEPAGLIAYPRGLDVALDGETMLVIDSGGIHTIDISAPEDPRHVVRTDTGFGSRALGLDESRSEDGGAVGDGVVLHGAGLRAIVGLTADAPTLAGNFMHSTWVVTDLHLEKNILDPSAIDLTVADPTTGLRVADVTDPRADLPPLHEVGESAFAVAIGEPVEGSSRYAYVAGERDLREIEPGALFTTFRVEEAFVSPRLALSADQLYAISPAEEVMRVYDVGDPALKPPERGDDVALGACSPRQIAVWEDHLYVLCRHATDGLPAWINMYGLEVPEAPEMVGTLPLDLPPMLAETDVLLVDGDRMYVSREWTIIDPAFERTAFVDIYDLADPAAPVVLGTFSSGDCIHSMAVDGDRAIIADCAGWVHAWDVSDPAVPLRLASAEIAEHGTLRPIALVGDVAAVFDENGSGLTLVEIGEGEEPTATATATGTVPSATDTPEPTPVDPSIENLVFLPAVEG